MKAEMEAWEQLVFGDTSGTLSGSARAGDQELDVSSQGVTILVGDARNLGGFAVGGDDRLSAYGFALGEAIGDAFKLTAQARGGDDVVVARGDQASRAFGDAEHITGNAAGGDDEVGAYSPQSARAYGDALVISGVGRGGNDTVSAGASLHGTPVVFGDAERLEGTSHGGDDVLIASVVGSMMWGDAEYVGAGASTGQDRFVIPYGNVFGSTIMDFEPGRDVVELRGYPVGGYDELAARFVETSWGVEIDFGQEDTIYLRGVTADELGPNDFELSRLVDEGVFLEADHPSAVHGPGWYYFASPGSQAFVGHPGELDVYIRDFGLFGLGDAAAPLGDDTIDVFELGLDRIVTLNAGIVQDENNRNVIVSREGQTAPNGEYFPTSYYQDRAVDGVVSVTEVPGQTLIQDFVFA
ncbi:hypothetical protein [Phenylobacterium sp.]|uniref:hypothetical protein n=1 Tax=Phenylobacterium sp. TaxID=1871053 RepID=UPI0035B3679C